MSNNVYYLNQQDEDDSSGGSNQGGQSGQVEFREFISTGEKPRNEHLSKTEQKHLIAIHRDKHNERVKKQKEKIDEYKSLREGKITLAAHRQGKSGDLSTYKSHPALADKAQFSGIDRKVNASPLENDSRTNNEKRQELVLKHQLRHQPEAQPSFNPKPLQR